MVLSAQLLVLGLGLFAAPPDWGARSSLRGELSAGLFATQGDVATASAETEWLPRLELDLALRRQHLVASYQALVGQTWPAGQGAGPTLLHQAALRHEARLSRRWLATASASLAAGEVRYGRSFLAFDGDGMSSRLPEVERLAFLGGDVDAALSWQLDRRQRLSLSAAVGVTAPRVEPDEVASFPEQARVRVALGYRHDPSAVDQLHVELEGRWVQFRPGPSYLALRPSVLWRRDLGRGWGAGSRLGVMLVDAGESEAGRASAPPPVQPVVELLVDGETRVLGWLGLRLDSAAALDGYADPVAATLAPRLALRSRVELAWNPGMLAAAQAYLYAPFGVEPGTLASWGPRDPLLAGGELSFTPWAGRVLRLDLGLRGFRVWGVTDTSYRVRHELVGFVGLSAGVDAG